MRFALDHCDEGWFELVTDAAKPGSRYYFRIDGEQEVPDPASRFQPRDVHGPSEVIDPLPSIGRIAAGVAADGKNRSSMNCMSELSRHPGLFLRCEIGSTTSRIWELLRWS